MSLQPVLPGVFEPRVARQHKRQRQTARAVYHRQRAIDAEKQANGHAETRKQQVLRILAWHWNVKNASPTALELLEWARQQGERLFDINSLRPRLTALLADGLVDVRAKRKCLVSGQLVWTWVIREIGSVEPRG